MKAIVPSFAVLLLLLVMGCGASSSASSQANTTHMTPAPTNTLVPTLTYTPAPTPTNTPEPTKILKPTPTRIPEELLIPVEPLEPVYFGPEVNTEYRLIEVSGELDNVYMLQVVVKYEDAYPDLYFSSMDIVVVVDGPAEFVAGTAVPEAKETQSQKIRFSVEFEEPKKNVLFQVRLKITDFGAAQIKMDGVYDRVVVQKPVLR